METVSNAVGQDSLSIELQSRFQRWLDARKPQEDEMLRNYEDAMRISRDDDTKGTGVAKAQKAKPLFVGSTRGKIRSARAKIKDSLFGSGKLPFDTEPTNEQLKQYSDAMEEILVFQLKDMGFKPMIGGATNALCTYGTSVIYGPFQRNKQHTTVGMAPDPQTGMMRMKETVFDYLCPYFEHGPTMDAYPDPEAQNERDGMGIYWSSWKQPFEVEGWANQPGYNAEAIQYAVTQLTNNSSSEGSDLTTDARANIYRYSKDGRVRVLRYFGRVNEAALDSWLAQNGQLPAPEAGLAALAGDAEQSAPARLVDTDRTVEAVIILAGGVVVKADRSPYKTGYRPALRAVYEEVEHEFWGVGIAENNEPNQKVINAAFRMYIEGKAMALMKICSIDRSKFEADEDFKMFPGKQLRMRGGLTPEERATAIIWHDTIDVTNGWENVIAMSERFSDDDTGITKYSQGTDASHLNKTATGISMILNASSLPMKEVIQNIDEMWIERAIEALIEWNMQNLTPEAVQVLLGEKIARVWAEIQQFGKTSFMKWKATGSSTFMMKEILMQKLQGFLQLVMSSPILAEKVDIRELLEQVWEAGEIGRETVVFDEETLAQNKQKNGPPPEMQQALAALDAMQKRLGELEQAAKDRAAELALEAERIASNERIRLAELSIKDRDSRVDAEAKLAGVEKTEAETAETVIRAGLLPSQTLTNEAVEVENEQ